MSVFISLPINNFTTVDRNGPVKFDSFDNSEIYAQKPLNGGGFISDTILYRRENYKTSK